MPGPLDPGRVRRDQRRNSPPESTSHAKEKALHIHPPKTGGGDPSGNGTGTPDYEDWTWDQLIKRARNIGVEGRSRMNKDELIHALRNH